MKNLYVLEHFDFSEKQWMRLNKLGKVHYFDYANKKQIDEALTNADAILFDWIDPNDLLPKMRKGQFICLPYTGCDWVETLPQAIKNGIVVSNIPNYSTNAVAEFHLSLLLSTIKHIPYFNEFQKKKLKVPFYRGMELSGKTIGIIGLGRIGYKLAELLQGFGVKIQTYNPHKKNMANIKDTTLDNLLKTSDVVCITCNLNSNSKNMINEEKLNLMKDNAVLTCTTGGIVDLQALDKILKQGKLYAVGLDDVEHQQLPVDLLKNPKVVCTYHRAYDTFESESNRIDLFIDNIEAFLKGKPINVINK